MLAIQGSVWLVSGHVVSSVVNLLKAFILWPGRNRPAGARHRTVVSSQVVVTIVVLLMYEYHTPSDHGLTDSPNTVQLAGDRAIGRPTYAVRPGDSGPEEGAV